MKIKGTKMCNTEVSPNTNRNTKWSYYSKLKRNNKVLLTEPFD